MHADNYDCAYSLIICRFSSFNDCCLIGRTDTGAWENRKTLVEPLNHGKTKESSLNGNKNYVFYMINKFLDEY